MVTKRITVDGIFDNGVVVYILSLYDDIILQCYLYYFDLAKNSIFELSIREFKNRRIKISSQKEK